MCDKREPVQILSGSRFTTHAPIQRRQQLWKHHQYSRCVFISTASGNSVLRALASPKLPLLVRITLSSLQHRDKNGVRINLSTSFTKESCWF